MSRKKKMPAIELPQILTDVITEYLGSRVVNKLSNVQQHDLTRLAGYTAAEVGAIVENSRLPLITKVDPEPPENGEG